MQHLRAVVVGVPDARRRTPRRPPELGARPAPAGPAGRPPRPGGPAPRRPPGPRRRRYSSVISGREQPQEVERGRRGRADADLVGPHQPEPGGQQGQHSDHLGAVEDEAEPRRGRGRAHAGLDRLAGGPAQRVEMAGAGSRNARTVAAPPTELIRLWDCRAVGDPFGGVPRSGHPQVPAGGQDPDRQRRQPRQPEPPVEQGQPDQGEDNVQKGAGHGGQRGSDAFGDHPDVAPGALDEVAGPGPLHRGLRGLQGATEDPLAQSGQDRLAETGHQHVAHPGEHGAQQQGDEQPDRDQVQLRCGRTRPATTSTSRPSRAGTVVMAIPAPRRTARVSAAAAGDRPAAHRRRRVPVARWRSGAGSTVARPADGAHASTTEAYRWSATSSACATGRGHGAVDHQQHPVAAGQQGRAAGHEHRRPAGSVPPHPARDPVLGRGVDGGGRIVQHQHRSVDPERPGEDDALALAAGQRTAGLAQHGPEAIGQGVDDVVDGGGDQHAPGPAPAPRFSCRGPPNSTASCRATSTVARASSRVTDRRSVPSTTKCPYGSMSRASTASSAAASAESRATTPTCSPAATARLEPVVVDLQVAAGRLTGPPGHRCLARADGRRRRRAPRPRVRPIPAPRRPGARARSAAPAAPSGTGPAPARRPARRP